MKINIEEIKKEPLKKERLAYNGETGNRIDVEIYLCPLRAIYKVGKEGNETANLFDNLKSAVDRFNYLEGMELDSKELEKMLEEDLEKFVDKYVGNNVIIGYELLAKQMELDDFVENIGSAYEDARKRGFDSIVIAVDTDLDNTYYINDTAEGFQCDLFDCVFDDLYSVVSQLYDELYENIIAIRIGWS